VQLGQLVVADRRLGQRPQGDPTQVRVGGQPQALVGDLPEQLVAAGIGRKPVGGVDRQRQQRLDDAVHRLATQHAGQAAQEVGRRSARSRPACPTRS
jgi:hypothetical protein